MQTSPPSLSFAPVLMKDAQCAELNQNQISDFYFQSYPENSSDCFPTPLRSDYLGIKDAQCARKNNGRKISYHITSCLGATGAQTRPNDAPKIKLSSKVAKFAGWIGIDLLLIFCINDYFCCAIISF